MRRMFAVALLALGLGCGADALGPVMTVDGEWFGVQNGYSLSMNLTQSATGEVTGSALVAGTSGISDAQVQGTFAYPSLVVTITPPGFDAVIYTGTMSSSEAKIDGKLNGSGFVNLELDVSKRR